MSDYEATRQRHLARFGELMPGAMERLTWPAERIGEYQTALLRQLLVTARERSSWHRARLAGIKIDAISAAEVRSLPVMTKDDLMFHWDEIVTDPRLTLDLANEHLDTITTDTYLFGEYHALASGGSSGVRGVFAWGWDAWALAYASLSRWVIRYRMMTPGAAAGVTAIVAASAATHMTGAMPATFANPMAPVQRFPVMLSLAEIVAGLNALQPAALSGYATSLNELARAAARGDLSISPTMISTTAEPLLPEIRSALESVWDAPVRSLWGTSEGSIIGSPCYIGEGMHLLDDGAIIEAVDANGDPVADGEISAKIYLTNLINPLLPLIRYEITDEVRVIPEPCACGSSFRRVDDIQGRVDDVFRYDGGVSIHPHVYRSPLSHHRAIIEYQVRQTPRGAEIDVRADGPLDLDAVRDDVAASVAGAGLASPEITLSRVDAIARTSMGKLKRFVTL